MKPTLDTGAFPILRIEVTVAAALVGEDDYIVGRNIADATLAFGWRLASIPVGVTDEAIQKALTDRIGPVLALVESALMLNGWVAMGQVEEPMNSRPGKTVGRARTTSATTIRVIDGRTGIHD